MKCKERKTGARRKDTEHINLAGKYSFGIKGHFLKDGLVRCQTRAESKAKTVRMVWTVHLSIS